MINKWLVMLSCLLILAVSLSSAQNTELSTLAQVIGQDLYFQRANTQTELTLTVGAVTPFGVGDRIRTGTNGRALITLTETSIILLLPNSEYSITHFEFQDNGQVFFEGRLRGIAIHKLMTNPELQYQLTTDSFEITNAKGLFAVWSVPAGLQAVTMSQGELDIQQDGHQAISLTSGTGFASSYTDVPLVLTEPLHAAQVISQSIGCRGIITTGDPIRLHLREGAALDYHVVTILRGGEEARVIGKTEDGRWYRVPYQTGFGWAYSSYIAAQCENLPQFPNLVSENIERIRSVTSVELSLLEPFYGTVVNNPVFYR